MYRELLRTKPEDLGIFKRKKPIKEHGNTENAMRLCGGEEYYEK